MLLCNFAYTIPLKLGVTGKISPFLLDSQIISVPAYIDYAAKIISVIGIFISLCITIPKHREILTIITVAFTGYLAEYFIIYNNPLLWIWFIPIGYSTIFGMFLIGIFVLRLIKK